jgi:hypothetical protein
MTFAALEWAPAGAPNWKSGAEWRTSLRDDTEVSRYSPQTRYLVARRPTSVIAEVVFQG